MDGYDIFRKLIFGTSFDNSKCKRRRKSKGNKQYKKTETSLPVPPKLEQDDTDDSELERSESKNNGDLHMEETHNVEDNMCDIDLLAASSESPLKKRKKKDMSLMKLTKIKHEEVTHFRRVHHIYLEGSDVPDPIENFEQLKSDYGLHSSILSNITKLGYVTPTPIQMQVIPLLIHERQVLACAPTGSGKTASFVIPVLHNLKGPQNVGFRALILAPTRELAKQIHQDCVRLAEGTNLRPCIIDKVKTVLNNPKSVTKYDILISTPNRLIYMLQHDPPLISLGKVQWLIVDESDKLFESGKQGFRDQLAAVYKACDSVHVKRAMFSATFSHDVEEWCKMNLDSVVSVSIGVRNTAAETVKQEIMFVGSESGKLFAFRSLVAKGLTPPVLVFVQSKERARELFNELIYDGINVDVIHADRTQLQRDNVVRSFRAGKIWVLICTELMGRGIDFKGVNLVVNYDFPPTAISYIHRIGRTGRAGKPGRAITFYTEDDVENLRSIAQVMKNAGCEVPEFMLQLKKKKKRKNTVALPIKRTKISTTPKYDIEKEAKMKKLIENSKKRKQRKKMKEQNAIAQSNKPPS